ncbi:MAG: hypothetical protein LC623_00205 [Halobacteriales archaeon]|nr:hypothetical protein [Halobacteriales archaeon]
MLRLLPALSLAALCALAALPAAQAQAGANDPKITVTLEVTPKAPTIPLGGAQDFDVTVKLATQNIYCSSQGSVTVALALKDSGLPGVTGTLPTSLDVPVQANVSPPTVTANSQGSAVAKLAVTVASSAAADHAHSFTVTANTPAALPTGCSALSAVPPPAASATAEVAMKTGAGMTSTATGVGATAGNCAANVSAGSVSISAQGSCPTTNKAFFLPLQVQVGALLAVALLARRR